MRAMVLARAGAGLRLMEVGRPVAEPGQVLIAVEACGVCRTDLHVVDGELKQPKVPLIPGHEIVGRVVELGPGSSRFAVGARVGVPWLGWACGECGFCRSGRENLCDCARFTGYTLEGAIIFAPVGELVPAALRAVAKGGVVVCAGIHMSDIPQFPYELLWGERVVVSVANLAHVPAPPTKDGGLTLAGRFVLTRAKRSG